MVTMTRKENTVVTAEFPQNVTTEELVEEFYKVKGEITLLGYHTTNKSKVLSERKHAIMWEIKKALSQVSKTKEDKIRKKLWEELGVVI